MVVRLIINSLLLRWTQIIVGFQRSNRSVRLVFQYLSYKRHDRNFHWSSNVFLIPRPYYCVYIPKMLTALWLLLWISNHSSSSVSRQDKNNLFSVNVFIFYAQKKSYNINNSWRFCRSSLLVLQCMTGVRKFNIYIYTGHIKV